MRSAEGPAVPSQRGSGTSPEPRWNRRRLDATRPGKPAFLTGFYCGFANSRPAASFRPNCCSLTKQVSCAHFRRNSKAGMVMVNLPTAGVDYHVPFGGRKGSSYGPREQGRYAAEFYTTVKTAYTQA